MSTFKIILTASCVGLAMIAALIFSGAIPGFRNTPVSEAGTVNLWGTLPEPAIADIIGAINTAHAGQFKIVYSAKAPESFEARIVDALAQGAGPDIILAPDSIITGQADKLVLLPYDIFPIDQYNQTFISGAKLFAQTGGLAAVPMYVDPLILFYNETLLNQAGVAVPPKTWSQVGATGPDSIIKTLAKIDVTNGAIAQSPIALGTFGNVAHAKDILALLIIQAGNQIFAPAVDKYLTDFGDPAATAALTFYTNFSNPGLETYAWNQSLSDSRDAFIGEKLALYLGRASEIGFFQSANPHLLFNITDAPDRENQPNRLTLGTFYGLALTRQSVKTAAAIQAIQVLSGVETSKAIAGLAKLPSARRDVLVQGSADRFGAILTRIALITTTWYDPDPIRTSSIFSAMVNDVISGRKTPIEAAASARLALQQLVAQ